MLDSDHLNAFATPGGFVLITKGLLARMRSEVELANVLAHEIAHVVKKHHLNAIRKGAGMQTGMNILGDFIAQGSRNPEITSRLVSGMKEVMLRGLDKDDELEADRAAQRCVAPDAASPAMCASVQMRPSVDASVHAGGASARGLFAACQDPAP